jgi:hypothetical protein
MTEDGGSKRLARSYPFGLAVLVLALFFWSSLSLALVGFPDRFMSDLDEAEVPLFGVFNWISLAMALWCICLGIAAGRWKIRKPFFYACAFYSAAGVVTLLIDLFCRATLIDGKGS